jgi:hypothetical protein
VDLETHDDRWYPTLGPGVLDHDQVANRVAELEDAIITAVQDAGTAAARK